MAASDYDAKKYKCKPWHGQRGPFWERTFKGDFENALRDQKDNFSNLHQYLFGKDFGGWAPGAPPHIAGGGALAAQNALSIQSRQSRSSHMSEQLYEYEDGGVYTEAGVEVVPPTTLAAQTVQPAPVADTPAAANPMMHASQAVIHAAATGDQHTAQNGSPNDTPAAEVA